MLYHLLKRSTLPWVCISDFNDMLTLDDKLGGSVHLENLLRGFCETVAKCQNLPLSGYAFT